MRLIFAGTPEFAVPALRAALAAGHDVALVLTQPDRPAGRGLKPLPCAVKQAALAAGLEVAQPETLKTPEIRQRLAQTAADAMIVAAYGLILPPAVLALPRLGCVNIHASLLPRWRGAAPIQRAILAGDAETGISIMQMDEGLDTGAVLWQEKIPVAADDDAQTLHDKLAELGAQCLVRALDGLARGTLAAQPQSTEGVTYAAKLTKAEAEIDWRESAPQIERAVRAYHPFPGAQAHWHGEPLKIRKARPAGGSGEAGRILAAGAQGVLVACGQGALLLTELQKAGGRRLPAAEFVKGHPLHAGDCFDSA